MDSPSSSSSETFLESEEEVVNLYNDDGDVVNTEPNTRKVYPKQINDGKTPAVRGPRG